MELKKWKKSRNRRLWER